MDFLEFDLYYLVVLTESRFSALRPEPDIQERDNYQPGRHFSDYFDSFLVM
jgi:hypothetical protein